VFGSVPFQEFVIVHVLCSTVASAFHLRFDLPGRVKVSHVFGSSIFGGGLLMLD
jgi:hypothetical protein